MFAFPDTQVSTLLLHLGIFMNFLIIISHLLWTFLWQGWIFGVCNYLLHFIIFVCLLFNIYSFHVLLHW